MYKSDDMNDVYLQSEISTINQNIFEDYQKTKPRDQSDEEDDNLMNEKDDQYDEEDDQYNEKDDQWDLDSESNDEDQYSYVNYDNDENQIKAGDYVIAEKTFTSNSRRNPIQILSGTIMIVKDVNAAEMIVNSEGWEKCQLIEFENIGNIKKYTNPNDIFTNAMQAFAALKSDMSEYKLFQMLKKFDEDDNTHLPRIFIDFIKNENVLHAALNRGLGNFAELYLEKIKQIFPELLIEFALQENEFGISVLDLASKNGFKSIVNFLAKNIGIINMHVINTPPELRKEWVCSTCSCNNSDMLKGCKFCGTLKKLKSWYCNHCKFGNVDSSSKTCEMCGLPNVLYFKSKEYENFWKRSTDTGYPIEYGSMVNLLSKIEHIDFRELDYRTENEGNTFFHVAAEKGNVETFNKLMTTIQKINPGRLVEFLMKRNMFQQTVLDCAIIFKQIDIVKVILTKCETIYDQIMSSCESTNCENTPLHLMVMGRNEEMVKVFLNHFFLMKEMNLGELSRFYFSMSRFIGKTNVYGATAFFYISNDHCYPDEEIITRRWDNHVIESWVSNIFVMYLIKAERRRYLENQKRNVENLCLFDLINENVIRMIFSFLLWDENSISI